MAVPGAWAREKGGRSLQIPGHAGENNFFALVVVNGAEWPAQGDVQEILGFLHLLRPCLVLKSEKISTL